jgi:acid phosphatase
MGTRTRSRILVAVAAVLLAAIGALAPPAAAASGGRSRAIEHIVVIYEENHSFDNLFGGWDSVRGVGGPGYAHRSRQRSADGAVLPCLPQNDVNLTALPVTCRGTAGGVAVDSAFSNRPFIVDRYIAPTDRTCPAPGAPAPHGVPEGSPGARPGGCTEDLVHRFYQEQYQIHGGRMDRYVAGSDALGLAMGRYDTRALPLYRYLHSRGAPPYVIADRFFQAAFGGSFLNHQWLIAAATPQWPGAVADGGPADLHSVVGADGSPANYPLHPTTGLKDGALTQAADPDGSCRAPSGGPVPPRGTVCGDYAVNTLQPAYPPYAPGTPPGRRLPPLTHRTIGDALTAEGVDWAWYAGGWDNAAGNVSGPGWTNGTTPGTCTDPAANPAAVYPYCADALFQYHHQPFAYFAAYAPGTAARTAHLRDETEFLTSARNGTLPPISFVKPIGEENEHPGYASEHQGNSHLVDLIQAIRLGPAAGNTAIVVTYDEFGGYWDHVPPPRRDRFGPGTRIPALVISPALHRRAGVDHTTYDTTSILAALERRYGLRPLSTRDASANPLASLLR